RQSTLRSAPGHPPQNRPQPHCARFMAAAASACSRSDKKPVLRAMPRFSAVRQSSSTRRIRKRSLSFCGGMKPRCPLAASEEDAIVFEFVDQIAHDIDVVRRDDEGAGGDALDL